MKIGLLWLVFLAQLTLLILTPGLFYVQTWAWMWFVELASPELWLIYLSAAYWVALVGATVFYWMFRIYRWIFEDEGPLPVYMWTLVVLWLPVTLIPTLLVLEVLMLMGTLAAVRKEYKLLAQ